MAGSITFPSLLFAVYSCLQQLQRCWLRKTLKGKAAVDRVTAQCVLAKADQMKQSALLLLMLTRACCITLCAHHSVDYTHVDASMSSTSRHADRRAPADTAHTQLAIAYIIVLCSNCPWTVRVGTVSDARFERRHSVTTPICTCATLPCTTVTLA
jgi:hypothetical protein